MIHIAICPILRYHAEAENERSLLHREAPKGDGGILVDLLRRALTLFINREVSWGKRKKSAGAPPKGSPPHLSFVMCITAAVILIHLFGTAGASIWAADTFLTAFFGLINIQSGSCDDYNKNAN